MTLEHDKMEQDQEAANYEACREAFIIQYPSRNPNDSEDCDAGDEKCRWCPWREEE